MNAAKTVDFRGSSLDKADLDLATKRYRDLLKELGQ